MNLTQNAYNAFKKLVTMDARISDLTGVISSLSHRLETTTDRLASRLENHAERLARLEGKFELLETSFSARRRKLPSGSGE
jgi:hypothetical protein